MERSSISELRLSDGVTVQRNTSFAAALSAVLTELTSGMSAQEILAAGEGSALIAIIFLPGCARKSKKQSIYGMG